MDKYTVDLDKVLNDFEYSELTEQSNGFTSQQQQSFNTFVGSNSGPNHTYSSKPTYSYESTAPYTKISANSSAKHTINNVFHSLNEYLNSDIRTELDQAAGSSLANLNEIEADIPTLVRRTSADRLDVAKIQDIFKTITKEDENNVNVVDSVSGGGVVNSSCPSVAVLGQNLADVKTINNNINSELNLNRVKDTNIDENLSLKVENTSVKDKNNIGKVQNSASNLVKYNNIDETPSLNLSNTEDNSTKPEQTNTIVETACLQVETMNNKVETTAVNNEKLIETFETHVSIEETPSVSSKTNDNKTLFEQHLPSTAVTMETIADKQSSETKDVEASRIQPIGFEDLDDMSDTEMESALAELEQEYNAKLDNNHTLESLLNNTAATDDECSVQKDLQTELAEVTRGMTVMLATDETDPTVPETYVTLATDQSTPKEINEKIEIVQELDTDTKQSGDNVQDMEEKEISDSKQEFKVIADKMLEDKERVEKIMQIAWEHRSQNRRDNEDERQNTQDNTDTSQNVQDNMNNTQNTRDNINKSQNIQDNIRKSQNVEDNTDTSQNNEENIDNRQNKGSNIDSSQNKVEIIDASQNKGKNIDKSQNKGENIDTSKNNENHTDTSKNNESHIDTSQDKEELTEKCQTKGEITEKCQNKKEITEKSQDKHNTETTTQNKPDFQEFIDKIQVAKEQFEKTTRRMYQHKGTSESVPVSTATVDIHVQQTQESTDTIQQSSEICDNMQVQPATGDVPTIIETPDISVAEPEQCTQSVSAPSIETGPEIQDTPAIIIQSDEVTPGTIAERRNSTLLRPNSLDLATEQQTDTLTINLIGKCYFQTIITPCAREIAS